MHFFGNVSLKVANSSSRKVQKMKVKAPEQKADPELQRQQAAAQQEKINTIQERLGTETDQALRYFGARRALSGAGSSGRSPLVGAFNR